MFWKTNLNKICNLYFFQVCSIKRTLRSIVNVISWFCISVSFFFSLEGFVFSVKKSKLFRQQNFVLNNSTEIVLALFPFPPTSGELQFFSVTSGFTMLIMKTKYVCHGLISLYVNFHNNRTMWSENLLVKICRWGEKGKEPLFLDKFCSKFVS